MALDSGSAVHDGRVGGAPEPELAERAQAHSHAPAVRQMFDRISPTYDLLNRTLSLGIDRAWRRRALAELARDLPQGPVLDSCAGTLDLSRALGERFAGRTLVAGDFARSMLEAGRPKAPAQTGLVACDAMRLPFPEGSLAGVVCGFGMRNLARPQVGIAEAARVLRPSGVFVVLEFYRPVTLWTRLFHAFYGRFLLPAVGGLISGDGGAYRYLSESMVGFQTRAQFEQSMREAGFRQVQGYDLPVGIASIVRGVK